MKENEYEKSLKEEVLPWANTEEDYVLAITGSAYSYIVSTENQLLKTLLMKCQIYARMHPDEKASLIKTL